MGKLSGNINTSTRWWRFKEIVRALFTRRGYRNHAFLRTLFNLALTVLLGYFLCFVASPAAVLLLWLVKENFIEAGPMVFNDPTIILGGWMAVSSLDVPGTQNVAKTFLAIALLALVCFIYYVFVVQERNARRNKLGMPKGIKNGEFGDGGIEENQIVLSQIHRTIDPRKPFDHAGALIGYSALLHKYFVSGLSNHSVTIAPPGTGKTTRYIIQQTYLHINAKMDSLIVFDPKGEIYELTGSYARQKGAQVILFDFDTWKRSELYNSVSEVYSVFTANWTTYNDLLRQAANAFLCDDEEQAYLLSKQAEMKRVEAFTTADTMAGSLAHALIPETIKSDIYWTPSARNFFHAVVGALATYTKDQWVGEGPAPFEPEPEQRTLKTIAYLIDQTTKWDKIEGKILLTDFFDGLGPDNPFSRKYAQIRNAEGANLSSLISSLNKYLGETSSPANDMIGYGMPKGYENLETIGEHKTIVYIVVSTESADKKVMLPIITKQIYDALIRCTKKHGGVLPYMTHFLMEELGSMKLIGDFGQFVTTGRGYGIRIHAVLQSEDQWRSMFGTENEKTIKNSINCTNYVSITDPEDAESLSKEIGDCTITTSSESSRGSLFGHADVSVTQRHERVRAVPASKIKEWNSDWGSFVRIDKLYENKLLNRLFFHRETARIALMPTTAPKYMPGSCEMGIETEEKANAVRRIAQTEDKSALRREIPSWNPFNLSEEDYKETLAAIRGEKAVGLSTSRDISKVLKDQVKNALTPEEKAWAYKHGVLTAKKILDTTFTDDKKIDVKAAYRIAEKKKRSELSLANRLISKMIKAINQPIPPQSKLDYDVFISRRSVLHAYWKDGLFDTLNDAASKREENTNAKEEKTA